MAAKSAASAPLPALFQSHLFVSGKVQGVFYRKYTRSSAQALGLTGWVRNLPDGRVEIVAEGTAEQLQRLREWCYTGSPHSQVTAVEDAAAPRARAENAQDAAKGEGKRTATAGALSPLHERQFSTFVVKH